MHLRPTSFRLLAATPLAAIVVGCMMFSNTPYNSAATQPATVVDSATTQPIYWLNQPAVAYVDGNDFEKLWNAAEQVIRHQNFRIDRTDYRQGLLTSEPKISAQFYETWRRDGASIGDRDEDTLTNVRRTIFFQFTRTGDNAWKVEPKVLVERQTLVEQKLRAVTPYQPSYWYPIRRDHDYEQYLAGRVRDELADP